MFTPQWINHAMMHPANSIGRPVRDREFGQRLALAMENFKQCPKVGRLTWLKNEITRRGQSAALESVRRWYSGEVKPRPDKLALLADILEVDVAWLSLGIDPSMGPREKKARNASADGAVNIIAGLIQMDGGHPAFPDATDKRATKDRVDLYAIIKGASYAFHVSAGTKDGGEYRFTVPAGSDAIILGVIRQGFSVEIIEITPDIIDVHGNGRGAACEVVIPQSADLHRITSFAARL